MEDRVLAFVPLSNNDLLTSSTTSQARLKSIQDNTVGGSPLINYVHIFNARTLVADAIASSIYARFRAPRKTYDHIIHLISSLLAAMRDGFLLEGRRGEKKKPPLGPAKPGALSKRPHCPPKFLV